MAFYGHQFIVVANFDNPATIHDDQSVGFAQRAQAVGDGNCGAALDQIVERLLDFLLGLGIDGRSGFIEDQDARVDQQGAGDGDALALTAGQALAAFADQ